MPRGSLLRRIVAGILILIFVAATIYSIAANFNNPSLFVAGAILGIAGLVEPVSIIWDRFIPDSTTRRRKPAAAAVRDADAYLAGRLRQFEGESKLFVELAGDTIIQTTFSSEGHQFDDIQKAVELHKGRFVLIGEPGAGKSTSLRQLMIQAIRDYRLKTNPRLPIEINLGLSETPTKADELLEYWWDKWYLPSVPDEHIVNDRVWFFMDGLNEMPLDSREERAKALKAFLDKHPTLPVIVTCRVRDYEDDEKLNLGLPMVRVHELDEGRIQEFINKRGASADLWDKIRSNDALRRMADNPYKLVMLIAVYQARRELPERLDELYGLYVKEAYRTYKDEREKVANTPLLRLTWPKLETRLKRLAFLMIKDGKGTAASVEWARRKIGKRALIDGINLGVLLVDGEDVKFYHQSLQWFFAIKRLSRAINPLIIGRWKIRARKTLIRHIGDLEEVGAPAVEPLIRVLADRNWDVRWAASNALARIGQPALEPLLWALKDRKPQVRSLAASTLGELGDIRALDPLLQALSDKLVQSSATGALGKLGDLRALDPLLQALNDKNWQVRSEAGWGLGQLGDLRALDPLLQALSDKNWQVRLGVIWALGQLGDARALNPLLLILKDKDAFLRSETAMALGQLGDIQALDSLTHTLKDKDAFVRFAAASALGQLGDTRSVDPLIKALKDKDSSVAWASAEALRTIGSPEALVAVKKWDRKFKFWI